MNVDERLEIAREFLETAKAREREARAELARAELARVQAAREGMGADYGDTKVF